MPETNDFNAIRISLASPEQIRNWSYGEVTKPETINYRTLKPEKDGLFCERIFGPTKDFECYCGKYKRVRYKGIICDRCGVEVARSKVRRERMGHIELAAPVSHIWFAKGTPTRIGLLLDLSPRSLERVLYFAQYVVTAVDEEKRKKILEGLEEELKGKNQDTGKDVQDKIAETAKANQKTLAELEEKRKAIEKEVDAELKAAEKEMEKTAGEVKKELQATMGEKPEAAIEFYGKMIAGKSSKVDADNLEVLANRKEAKLAELRKEYAGIKEERTEDVEALIEAHKDSATRESNKMRRELDEKRRLAEDERQAALGEVEEIRPRMLLPENRFRELRDKYGDFFKAAMGAEAVLDLLTGLDLEKLKESLGGEIHSTSGQRRKKATKMLRVVESFRKSGNDPAWMVLRVLPVLPPDLRPMVQLDGGRFATSDLNDLYRRTINRNNRLRRLLELGAPEIIIRNEKRMLQEAVDALIDNGRRGRAIEGSHNHRLKSLSDMLRGKQGRFRQNLLGKRVDYSGRSVIVVGPDLALNQCGLPKKMALELFKPLVMHRLVALGLAHNIKSAKRMVERVRPEVWDVLEDVIKNRPVLLNRAPTLHRLGIQAFQPVLVEGSAIQIHPLVCAAFNADFDGDQMAVHVPLSRAAVMEAKKLMMSTNNMLSPSSGEPVVAPTLDMVLGCFYLTTVRKGAKGEGRKFAAPADARLMYDLGDIDLQAEIQVRGLQGIEGYLKTSVGRVIFNQTIPAEANLPYLNKVMDKRELKETVGLCYQALGNASTAAMLDAVKKLGFRFATQSGATIAINDIIVPDVKKKILDDADKEILALDKQFQRGLITQEERYREAVKIWTRASEDMEKIIKERMPTYGSIYMMATSGAKGNIAQVKQMAGMRGLMTDPRGRIIELPIKASFREGLSVLEYFISTHGARKGLADTALRTADSGYLTRRLIDVAQDVIVLAGDCSTMEGVWITDRPDKPLMGKFEDRIVGRMAASAIANPVTGEVMVERNQEITEAVAKTLGAALKEYRAKQLKAARVPEAELGIAASWVDSVKYLVDKKNMSEEEANNVVGVEHARVYVRSPLTCGAKRGVCQHCYGRSLARGRLVQEGEAVGIIAAQSIGEPGTQLTMRTFHTGGVAGVDITSGLPRVEELFEARSPKGQAIVAEIDGRVEVQESDEGRRISIVHTETYTDEYDIPAGFKAAVTDGTMVEVGTVLADKGKKSDDQITARIAGKASVKGKKVSISYEENDERHYALPAAARLIVKPGQNVRAGDRITEGPVNPQDILRILGRDQVQEYMVEEVQKVYRAQGVTINDKHIEIIVRQMLRKVRVDTPGDTELLPGQLLDRFAFEEVNAKIVSEGGEPATAQPVLLGVTKASLNTESFLAAASFQETTRILTEAAVSGAVDHLLGPKENVIIGRLIPARSQEVQAELAKPSPALSMLEGNLQPIGEGLDMSLGKLAEEAAGAGDDDLDDIDDDEDDDDDLTDEADGRVFDPAEEKKDRIFDPGE
ncbi:MAG: DNA-directed RNA polymerase subunit beta' [Chloroflexi bacterium]|nr:DNA-directed RNA polymerase subunit beta' [Chloroflexota bacterium]